MNSNRGWRVGKNVTLNRWNVSTWQREVQKLAEFVLPAIDYYYASALKLESDCNADK